MAESEGLKDAAKSFRQIAKVEAWHEARYRRLLDNIEKDLVFAKPEPVKWICRKCGFVHEGPRALKVCPACDHPQAYQEIYAENF
jgi:rubrerythrin